MTKVVKATDLLPEGFIEASPMLHNRCLAIYHTSRAVYLQRFEAGRKHFGLALRHSDRARAAWDVKRHGAWKTCGPTADAAMTYALRYFAIRN